MSCDYIQEYKENYPIPLNENWMKKYKIFSQRKKNSLMNSTSHLNNNEFDAKPVNLSSA